MAWADSRDNNGLLLRIYIANDHADSDLNPLFFLFSFQVDASVCTEIATMTEPDCMGAMEPGSSVTLEGIVWHETDNGKDKVQQDTHIKCSSSIAVMGST